jgi:hypothetical protein
MPEPATYKIPATCDFRGCRSKSYAYVRVGDTRTYRCLLHVPIKYDMMIPLEPSVILNAEALHNHAILP